MLKSIKQIATESKEPTVQELYAELHKCTHCGIIINKKTDKWLYQDDGSYIHIDCIEPALEEYKALLEEICPSKTSLLRESMLDECKLLSKLDPREPFGIESWHETCEWCGYITDSPYETHNCPERI